MQGGRLRNKAEIFTADSSTNAFGEIELTHTSIGTFYCSVMARPYSENKDGQALVSTVKYDLRFRYYTALNSLDESSYIMVDGKRLEIIAVSHVQHKQRQIQIICEER